LYFPNIITARHVIDSGELGEIEVAIVNHLGMADHPGNPDYQPRWRHELAAGGGILMDMMHLVYLAELLLGSPMRRVSAWVHARKIGAEIEDLAICRYESDAKAALVNVGWGHGPA